MDYRYMPEPDLPPLDLDLHWIDELRHLVVESPYEHIRRYKEDFGFNKEYINGLISDVTVNNYFEQRSHFYHTDPSISISISLFSSPAYSSGSFLTIGEMKPFTIIAIAFSSSTPRDWM